MPQVGLPISERVIREIAETTNSDARELPPLYEVIDPEALDTLVESMSNGAVSFTYMKLEVTVTDDGAISVNPVAESP